MNTPNNPPDVAIITMVKGLKDLVPRVSEPLTNLGISHVILDDGRLIDRSERLRATGAKVHVWINFRTRRENLVQVAHPATDKREDMTIDGFLRYIEEFLSGDRVTRCKLEVCFSRPLLEKEFRELLVLLDEHPLIDNASPIMYEGTTTNDD